MAGIGAVQEQYAPLPPVAEEQPVAPVAPAAAPVEPTPAPAPTGGGLGAVQQAVETGGTAPSPSYDYGAGLSAPLPEEVTPQAPVAPPPAAPNTKAETALPVDPFSGIGDVAGSIRDNLAQGDLKSAAMNVLDAPGLANTNERNVVAQRAKDYALHGNPDYTTGNIGPSGFLENPGAIPANIGHGLMTTVSEFTGMPDWVPSSTEKQSIEFYQNNPEAVRTAQEREKTEGVIAWYNVWNEAQGNTLATGGVPGLVSDAIRGGADPLNLGAAGATGLGSGISQIARNAGHIGIARGTDAIVKGGNLALDPVFEGGGTILSKGVQKVLPIFRPGEQVAGQIGNEKVVEGVATAVQDIRANPGMPGAAPSPDPTLTYGPLAGPPPSPLALPESGTVGPNLSQPITVPAMRELPPPSRMGVPVNETAQDAARVATNTHVVDEIVRARQATEAAQRPPIAQNVGGRELVRGVDPVTGRERTQYADGTLPTTAQMEGARKRLLNVKPRDFVPAQYGHAESQNALWRGLLNQEGFLYDDWPAHRINDARVTLKEDKNLTPLKREQIRKQIEAGNRFNRFLAERIRIHGDEEVQRVLDNIQREADDDIAKRGIDPKLATDYAENRLAVLADAVVESGRKQSFEVVVNGQPLRFYGNSNTFLRPRAVGISNSLIPRENPLRNVTNGTILGFPDPPSLHEGAELLSRMGVRPDAKVVASDPAFLTKFTRMLLDPEGFRHTGRHARTQIEQRRLNGEITDERAQQLLDYIDVRGALRRMGVLPGAGGTPKTKLMTSQKEWLEMDFSGKDPDEIVSIFDEWSRQKTEDAILDDDFILEELRNELDNLGLTDVKMSAGTLPGSIQGAYDPKDNAILISTIASYGDLRELPIQHFRRIINHEAIHAFRAMKLIGDREWDILVDAARRYESPDSSFEGMTFFDEAKYQYDNPSYLSQFGYTPDTADPIWEEEAVAQLFAFWRVGGQLNFRDRTFISELFDFIEEFLSRIRGNPRITEVLGKIDSGEVGSRSRTVSDFDREGYNYRYSQEGAEATFREGNEKNINWEIMKREHDRLTANWDDPLVDAPFNPDDLGISLNELRNLDNEGIDPAQLRERLGVTENAAAAPDVPPTTGVDVRPEPDGSFGVYHDGNRVATATTEAQANVQANRLQMAAGESPSTRRIDDLGEPGTEMPQNPVAAKAQAQTQANKHIFTDPQLDHAARYPNLTAKLDDAAVRQGKESFLARIRRARAAMKANSTRMRAMGDTDLPDFGDPELDNSGMAYGVKALLHQIDTDFPLRVNNEQVPIYTYTKQQMDLIANLPLLRKSIDPKNAKAMRFLKDVEKRYEQDLGELDLYSLTAREQDELVTMHVSRTWAESVNKGKPNVPKAAPNGRGVVSEAGGMIKNLVDFRRGVGLTNWVAAPRQILNQFFGNTWGLFMGKPSALLDMTNMAELRRHVARLHADNASTVPNNLLQNVMAGYGAKAPNTMIMSKGDRTQAGHEVEVSGKLGVLRDYVAPKFLRDWVSGPDELAKGAVAGRTFRSGMRREVDALPTNAKLTAARMSTRRQGMEGITAQIERKLPQALEQFRTPHFNRPMFTGEQLERTIKDIFEADVKRGTINRESLNVYADRMKRDWNTVVNSEKQYAAQEVKRVMFSWDNTRADDIIQNIFLYHYWATRAGFLYSKEMLKRPYLITLYMDAAEQIQMEAEQGDYPNWMTGFTRILNSPLGVALFMSPLDMISTAFHLNELEMGAVDGQGDSTLSGLGQLKGMFPFVWNPAVELALTMSGAFGPGASMPNNMTGLNRLTGFAADIINYANYNGMLPGNLGKDAMGNPIPIAPRPLDDVILKVAGHFGMPVVPSMSSFEKETTMYLYDEIVATHGLLDATTLNATVAEIYERAKQGDIDPMLYEAQAQALANSMQGPEIGFLPEALRPIVGAAIRYTSPVRLTARSETGFLIQYPDATNTLPSGNTSLLTQMADAGSGEFAVKATKRAPFQTQRAKSLDVAYQDWWDGGNPELAALDDTFWDIGGNRIGTPLTVGGVTYTPTDLNAMSEGERYDVTEDWLEEQGYTRADLDAMQDYKDQVIAENPDVGGYLAFQNYARDYPGGLVAFVDEAVKTSPSFAAYMAQQGQPGTPQYYEFADSRDAYFALSGEKSSVYGQDNLPEAGTIPGLPAGTNFVVKYQTDKAIDDATSGGSNEFTEFVETVQTDVNRIYAAQEWLNTNYPGTSLLLEGQWLDGDLYTAMKNAGVAPPKLEDAGAAYEYYTWLENNATATDLSVEAFLDQRESSGTSWEELPDATPEMIGDQRGFATQQAQPLSKEAMQQIGIPTSLVYESPMYTGPSENNPVSMSIPASFPIKEVYRGADGWSQVSVTTVGGGYQIGWVPTTTLVASA